MATTIAFDVYETLIDTSGVILALEKVIGDRAAALSDLWRSKQLEYSFRRGLMQNYRDFSVCTRQALDYACQFLDVDISDADKKSLMEGYKVLPAFADVDEGLIRLGASGVRMFAFSNGRAEDVRGLLANAGIEAHFEGVVSVDDIRSFKPNPAVYAHFLRQAGARGSDSWLVSGNPFDVIGAMSAGLSGAWVKRSAGAVFDPWEIQPTVTIADLGELPDALKGSS
jgi:2-haloacid dehalogenase